MEEDNTQIINEENGNNSHIDNTENVDNNEEVKVLSEDFIQNDSVPDQVTVANEGESENPESQKEVKILEENETAEKKEDTTQQPENKESESKDDRDELDDLFDDIDKETASPSKTNNEENDEEKTDTKDKEEADEVEDVDETESKKKSKKESKKKKDKASKKDKKKLKKKEEIESLKSKIFGDSDDEFDNVLNQMDDDNLDKDDEDVEENSKKILEEIVEKKKGKKQKKRKTDETKKRKSKRQKSTGGEEETSGTDNIPRDDLDDILDEMDDDKNKEGTSSSGSGAVDMNDFDMILESLKQGRSSRRKKTDKLPEETEDNIKAFISKMDHAAEDDLRANKSHQPALNKIKMLTDVERYLGKKHLQDLFISNGVLTVIKKWIDPLPDKSLPNLKVREVIFRSLTDMTRIRTEDLKDSGVGRTVMLLSKHPQETLQNKKMAKALIEQWSRPIFGLKDRYKEANHDEIQEENQDLNSDFNNSTPIRNSTKGMSADLDAPLQARSRSAGNSVKDSPTNYARIPDKIALDFKVMPKSNIEAQSLLSKPKRGSSDKQLAKKRAPPSKKGSVPRAIPMSIEGRNMY